MLLKTEYCAYEDVHLQIGKYQRDGSMAVTVWSSIGEPIATLTVCLCDGSLAWDEAYVDTNNCQWVVGFIEQEGLGKRTGRIGRSGYCTYPVVKFDIQKIRALGVA